MTLGNTQLASFEHLSTITKIIFLGDIRFETERKLIENGTSIIIGAHYLWIYYVARGLCMNCKLLYQHATLNERNPLIKRHERLSWGGGGEGGGAQKNKIKAEVK